jgi:3-hydroxyacyl-CoA dehydrogenase
VSEAAAPGGVTRVGVIGAGQMGAGIAHAAALAGPDVVLPDADEAALGGRRPRSGATSRAKAQGGKSGRGFCDHSTTSSTPAR